MTPIRTSGRAVSESVETPKRANVATLLGMLHDERMAQASKPGREDRPTFTLKRSTASGSLGVVGIDVYVPVCEEFPTTEAAHDAARAYMDDLCAHYPLPDGDVRAK
jgi:hypothetical protein